MSLSGFSAASILLGDLKDIVLGHQLQFEILEMTSKSVFLFLALTQAYFWTFRKKLRPQKTQNSRKIPKKLKNRQLNLSWIGDKLNENSIFRGKT